MSHDVLAEQTSGENLRPLRNLYREEMNCQIVHDSIHRRPGWTLTYVLRIGDVTVGYGSLAVGGPWKDRATLLEFYVLPEWRTRAFDLFDALLKVSSPRFMETQSNDSLSAVMLNTYAHHIASEKIVFRDSAAVTLPSHGATLLQVTSNEEIQAHIKDRQGGAEWMLELNGSAIGKGGIMFHYNPPYGDIYMEVAEPFRRKGFGSYLVQELKSAARMLNATPCARCDTTNIASRRTLQKAGFVPFANIMTGDLGEP